uniref:G_PROTEIN_RECEP_F1_2 domain-containing protein n=1 Tax=Macrostomum lignano TaxID=282301 RepID=A0A1I8GXG9_9PLAT
HSAIRIGIHVGHQSTEFPLVKSVSILVSTKYFHKLSSWNATFGFVLIKVMLKVALEPQSVIFFASNSAWACRLSSVVKFVLIASVTPTQHPINQNSHLHPVLSNSLRCHAESLNLPPHGVLNSNSRVASEEPSDTPDTRLQCRVRRRQTDLELRPSTRQSTSEACSSGPSAREISRFSTSGRFLSSKAPRQPMISSRRAIDCVRFNTDKSCQKCDTPMPPLLPPAAIRHTTLHKSGEIVSGLVPCSHRGNAFTAHGSSAQTRSAACIAYTSSSSNKRPRWSDAASDCFSQQLGHQTARVAGGSVAESMPVNVVAQTSEEVLASQPVVQHANEGRAFAVADRVEHFRRVLRSMNVGLDRVRSFQSVVAHGAQQQLGFVGDAQRKRAFMAASWRRVDSDVYTIFVDGFQRLVEPTYDECQQTDSFDLPSHGVLNSNSRVASEEPSDTPDTRLQCRVRRRQTDLELRPSTRQSTSEACSSGPSAREISRFSTSGRFLSSKAPRQPMISSRRAIDCVRFNTDKSCQKCDTPMPPLLPPAAIRHTTLHKSGEIVSGLVPFRQLDSHSRSGHDPSDNVAVLRCYHDRDAPKPPVVKAIGSWQTVAGGSVAESMPTNVVAQTSEEVLASQPVVQHANEGRAFAVADRVEHFRRVLRSMNVGLDRVRSFQSVVAHGAQQLGFVGDAQRKRAFMAASWRRVDSDVYTIFVDGFQRLVEPTYDECQQRTNLRELAVAAASRKGFEPVWQLYKSAHKDPRKRLDTVKFRHSGNHTKANPPGDSDGAISLSDNETEAADQICSHLGNLSTDTNLLALSVSEYRPSAHWICIRTGITCVYTDPSGWGSLPARWMTGSVNFYPTEELMILRKYNRLVSRTSIPLKFRQVDSRAAKSSLRVLREIKEANIINLILDLPDTSLNVILGLLNSSLYESSLAHHLLSGINASNVAMTQLSLPDTDATGFSQLAASDLGMIEKVVQKPSVNFSFTLSHLYADSIVPFANWSLGEGFRQLPNASTLHRSIQQAFVSSQNLSVATKIYPPFVMYRTEDNDGKPTVWQRSLLSGLKYTIHHVFDNHFGSIVNSSGNIEQWNGLVYELMNNMADVAVGPITVTYERERVIDFTAPYMSFGLAVIMKQSEDKPALFQFLNPFHRDVWLFTLLAVAGTALFIFAVARLSPYEWLPPSDSSEAAAENSWTLHNAVWFSVSSLLQQGCETSPSAASVRIAGTFWWFFILVFISSYTANLAAFLTVSKLNEISNLQQLASQDRVKYGMEPSGSTFSFFLSTPDATYQKMHQQMEVWNTSGEQVYIPLEQGIERVRRGDFAYITESPLSLYYRERDPDCSLVELGDVFNPGTYGFAVVQGNVILRDMITQGILKLLREQYLEVLSLRWLTKFNSTTQACSLRAAAAGTPTQGQLSMDAFNGLFITLASGMAISAVVLLCEILVKLYMLRKSKMSGCSSLSRMAKRAVSGKDLAGKSSENYELGQSNGGAASSLSRESERPDNVVSNGNGNEGYNNLYKAVQGMAPSNSSAAHPPLMAPGSQDAISVQVLLDLLTLNETPDASVIEAIFYKHQAGHKLSSPFYIGLCVAFGALLVTALIGNLLVLYSIISCWTQRKTHRCLYLNLITCDLLVATVIIPATCFDQLDSRWLFGGSVTCGIRQGLSVCLMFSSVHTATVLSWLRSLAAKRAYRPPKGRTEGLLVAAIWLVAVALSCPAAVVSEAHQLLHVVNEVMKNQLDRPVNWPVCIENWDRLGQKPKFWYGFAILHLACVLPLLSLGVAYFRICRAIYRSNRVLNAHKRCQGVLSVTYHHHQNTPDNTVLSMRPNFSLASTCSAINRRKRATNSRRMFLLGLGLVLIFALTQLVRAYWSAYKNKQESDASPDFHRLLTLFHLLALTNCLVNPFYLLATHAWYRKRSRRLLQRLRCRFGQPCCHVSWNCNVRLGLRVIAVRRTSPSGSGNGSGGAATKEKDTNRNASARTEQLKLRDYGIALAALAQAGTGALAGTGTSGHWHKRGTGTGGHWHKRALAQTRHCHKRALAQAGNWHKRALAQAGTGTSGHWHKAGTGTSGHWHKRALAQAGTGTSGHWHKRALAQTGTATSGHWHKRALAQTGTGTSGHWHKRALAQNGHWHKWHWHKAGTGTSGHWHKRALEQAGTGTNGHWNKRHWHKRALALAATATNGHWHKRGTGTSGTAQTGTGTNGHWHKRALAQTGTGASAQANASSQILINRADVVLKQVGTEQLLFDGHADAH